MDEAAQVVVKMPYDTRNRARKIARRLRTTISQLIRDSLTEKVEYLEAKLLAEEEKKRFTRASKRDSTKRKMRSLGDSPLAPVKTSLAPTTTGDLRREDTDENDGTDLYELHAKKIHAALDYPTEKRLRTAEAVSAIKRAYPLTHPPHGEIVAALEQAILRLRASEPAATPTRPLIAAPPAPRTLARIIDEAVGRVINPEKIRSFGDVEAEEINTDQ